MYLKSDLMLCNLSMDVVSLPFLSAEIKKFRLYALIMSGSVAAFVEAENDLRLLGAQELRKSISFQIEQT